MRNENYLVSLILLILFINSTAFAQNPDLQLSNTERDSILKTYDNFFPIWGRDVIKAGFDLPYPVGLNVNAVYIGQPIAIDNLRLGIGDFPVQPVEFVQFDNAESDVASYNLRTDLWVLPFLNVYGMFGQGWSKTNVKLKQPIQLESGVEQKGTYWGVGFTTTIGIKKNFLAVDVNWSWADMELLNEPVRARILGLRYGRNFRLGGKKRLAVWVGTMNQNLESVTEGRVRLNEVLPGMVVEELETREYQNSLWYRLLEDYQQAKVDHLADRIIDGYDNGIIEYGLDKQVAALWNLLIGANLEFNKNWHLRVEAGLIKRYQVLVNLNYRFQL
jgi:hypothetical protein